MRAGFGRCHAAAFRAKESVVEEQRRDAERGGIELVENIVSVERAVVISDARVVAADDEVRAAVIFAHDRMEDRLRRAGVAHRRRQHAEQRAVRRIIIFQPFLSIGENHSYPQIKEFGNIFGKRADDHRPVFICPDRPINAKKDIFSSRLN